MVIYSRDQGSFPFSMQRGGVVGCGARSTDSFDMLGSGVVRGVGTCVRSRGEARGVLRDPVGRARKLRPCRLALLTFVVKRRCASSSITGICSLQGEVAGTKFGSATFDVKVHLLGSGSFVAAEVSDSCGKGRCPIYVLSSSKMGFILGGARLFSLRRPGRGRIVMATLSGSSSLPF